MLIFFSFRRICVFFFVVVYIVKKISMIQTKLKLAVPIIYTLLWSEYNYRHVLEL